MLLPVSDETGGTGERSPSESEIERRLRELSAEIAHSHAAAAKERARKAEQARQGAGQQGRGGTAGEASRRPAHRGRRVASWIAAIVILAGGAGLAWHQYSGKPASSANGTPTATASASSAPASASSAPGGEIITLSPDAGPPPDPFADTPADHWADGAAGITVPAAKPVGSYTSAQVTAAYATTRKILIAQNLDPATLRGGKPAAFESLLSLEQRNEFVRDLDKAGVAKDGSPLSTRAMVASFAPGSTDLVGTVIKVHGTMSARSKTDNGTKVLDVDVNYRFVYVVEPHGRPQDWMRVVGQVYGDVEFFSTQDPAEPLQPWIASAFPGEAGIQCDIFDGFIHPDYPNGPASSAQPSDPASSAQPSGLASSIQPSGPTIDPYSMATPQATGSGACQPTTGT